jgi:phosphatidylserine decarboxylase
VSSLRRSLLTVLPKILVSRTTGLLAHCPLPTGLRSPAYRAFARRYGADLAELADELTSFRSLAEFFQRPLRAGARPLADAPLLCACDGRIVTSGPLDGDRIPQVKGVDYGLAEFLGSDPLARSLHGGSQQTIYLAPGDYHRVHSPFAATITSIRAIRGTLFPVNPAAVRAIRGLFVRNARVVFEAQLDDGRPGAVVMVGALNVGHVHRSCPAGTHVSAGDELGRFGFGSTVVCVVAQGGAAFGSRDPERRVQMGSAATGA